MSLIVTATGTEVGKTIVSALLLHRYQGAGAGYWKPVATGASTDRDLTTVRALAPEGTALAEELYLYEPPVSPHLAARWQGETIEPDEILARFAQLRAEAPHRPWIVEGIGGLLVPLRDDSTLLADLFVALELPCLLVASSEVGTLNHTLLTLEAMRHRGLECAGVVLNGPPNPDNRDDLERFGDVEVLGEIPPLDPLDRGSLARLAPSLDLEGQLERWLFGGLHRFPESGTNS